MSALAEGHPPMPTWLKVGLAVAVLAIAALLVAHLLQGGSMRHGP